MKSALRARMRALRAGLDPALGAHLAEHVLAACPPPPGAVVAGYWPLEGEIDIRPLLEALAGRGHTIGLPETPKRGEALAFHRWQPGAPLVQGRFGTLRPATDPLVPDILFVPLLAFDRRGHRLGYGAGYYDRTLQALPRSWTCGCGFAAQEVDEIPAEPHDRQLNAIATEAGVLIVE